MDIESIIKESKKFGNFTLSSGEKSDYYYDIKEVSLNPKKLNYMATLISADIKPDTDKIMGIELGSVMLATIVSRLTEKPLIILRKEPKEYGLQDLIVGSIEEGEKITIIDDVFTTGKSLIKAMGYVHSCCGEVNDLFVVVNRNPDCGWKIKSLWDELP